MSIKRFAEHIVRLLVVERSLVELRTQFASQGELNEAEALIYALFPVHIMVGLRIKADALPIGSALIVSVAKLAKPHTPESVTARLQEYAEALFEGEPFRQGRLSVARDGQFHLARHACRHILGREVQNIALLHEVGADFHATFTAFNGGAVLKELFDNYQQFPLGDDKWADAIRAGLREGKEL